MSKTFILFYFAILISFSAHSSLSDTIVFDLSQAVFLTENNVNYIEFPVKINSNNNAISSFDFWFQFDLSKLVYVSTTSVLSGLDSFSFFNNSNSYLSNTSSGTSINYSVPSSINIVLLKFIVLGTCTEIFSNDFYNTSSLVNGVLCSNIFYNGENNFELTASASSSSICIGDSVTLVGGGATTYTWSNGVTNGLAFNPVETTSYLLIGSDPNGCQDTTSIIVSVFPLPDVTANSSASIVCLGQSVTLSGSGAASYSWSAGVVNGTPYFPTETTTFTVTGVDLNFCSNSSNITIIVDSCVEVDELFLESLFSVYPNPANEYLVINNFNYPLLTNFNLKIENSLGQEVFKSTVSQKNFIINLVALEEKGIFYLKLLNSQDSILALKKIVIN